MKLMFTEPGWRDHLYWQENEPRIPRKVNGLILECSRTPFTGTAKPEPLRRNLKGWWSRRITDEHRLIYRVEGDVLWIGSCRFHYGD